VLDNEYKNLKPSLQRSLEEVLKDPQNARAIFGEDILSSSFPDEYPGNFDVDVKSEQPLPSLVPLRSEDSTELSTDEFIKLQYSWKNCFEAPKKDFSALTTIIFGLEKLRNSYLEVFVNVLDVCETQWSQAVQLYSYRTKIVKTLNGLPLKCERNTSKKESFIKKAKSIIEAVRILAEFSRLKSDEQKLKSYNSQIVEVESAKKTVEDELSKRNGMLEKLTKQFQEQEALLKSKTAEVEKKNSKIDNLEKEKLQDSRRISETESKLKEQENALHKIEVELKEQITTAHTKIEELEQADVDAESKLKKIKEDAQHTETTLKEQLSAKIVKIAELEEKMKEQEENVRRMEVQQKERVSPATIPLEVPINGSKSTEENVDAEQNSKIHTTMVYDIVAELQKEITRLRKHITEQAFT
jgi:DNA repair exonuclease SbcCD ATPase subunit